MPKRGKSFEFRGEKDELDLGVKVMDVDPVDGRVIAVSCKFCIYFGREDVKNVITERKRKRRSTVTTFKNNFRRDNIKLHMINQHSKTTFA